MSFAMSLPRTKRLRHINPDGTEVFQEEDRWELVRAVHTQQQTQEEASDAKEGETTEQPSASTAPRLPLEALEKLQMAKGEVSMMVDLIEMLEAQQHLGIAPVPPQKSTVQNLTRQRDLRLQTKANQLRDAAQRLRKGVQGLSVHLQLEDRYFDGVAHLATAWHVRPSSDFGSGGAPFQADLRVQTGKPATATEAATAVDLGRNADGSVQVISRAGRVVKGAGLDAALLELQEGMLWKDVAASFDREAQTSSRVNAAQALVTGVLSASQGTHPDMRQLRCLLLRSYLAALRARLETGVQPKVLPRLADWLRHKWFAAFIRRSLDDQSTALEKASGRKVSIQPVHIEGASRSALRVESGDTTVHLVLRADTLEARGVGALAGGGSRWGNAGVISSYSKLEFASLLETLLSNRE